MKSNFYKLVAAIVVLIWSTAAHAQLITTIAGSGSAGGWLAWGGPATQCQLNNPIGISIGPDPSGLGNDIYIADSLNNIIRMIDPNGNIQVFAGGGTTGLGDGLPAVQAGLSGPTGVASDGGYGVYIADCNNNRVRYVNLATGIISTVVGTGSTSGSFPEGIPANTANVNQPYGVRFVGGELFIAEKGGNVIRKVDALGKIYTVAGYSRLPGYTRDGGPDTAAEFHNPTGVAVDPATGDVYIADQLNNVVRKIKGSNYMISTFAGSGYMGYAGDAGIATATGVLLNTPTSVAWDGPPNNCLYITDMGNHVIRKVDAATNIISTFAGSGTSGNVDGPATTVGPGGATFMSPAGICVNGGNIYVSDTAGQLIRKITKVAGVWTVSTFAGVAGVRGYNGTGAPMPAINAWLNEPGGVVTDATGTNVYIADAGNNIARVVNAGVMTDFAGTPGAPGTSGDGGLALAAELTYPVGLAVDAVGNVYISDQGAHEVREVLAGIGSIKSYAGEATLAGYNGDGRLATTLKLDNPYGITIDNNGNLLIADASDNRIRIVDNVPVLSYTPANMYTFAGNGRAGYGGLATWEELNGPTGVMVSSAGNMYIADRGNNVVRWLDIKGVMGTYAGTGAWGYTGDGVAGGATTATFQYPVSVAFYTGGGTMGQLFVGDAANNVVRMIDVATGTSTRYAGTSGGAGWSGDGSNAIAPGVQIGYVAGLDVDQTNGDLYIVDQKNSVVRKVDGGLPHIITTVAGTGVPGYLASGGPATSAMLTNPYSVATDKNMNIFVADRDNHVIRKIDKNFIISVYAGTGFAGFLGDGGSALTAQLSSPNGVALDGAGNLYISDMGNDRIRKVTPAGTITTIVGNGTVGSALSSAPLATELYYPDGVCADYANNLFIADGNNNRVLKLNMTTGSLTNFAGNGTAGYSGDLGAAAGAELNDPKGVHIDGGGNVYIADFLNNCVRKVDAASGNISTVAGTGSSVPGAAGDGGPATAALLANPASICMDTSHSLIIADFSNNVVRKVNPAGVIMDIAGNYTAGYSGDGGQATAAQLNNPAGVQVDTAGSVYIADRSNNVIRKVTSVLLAEYDTTYVISLCQDSCITLTNTSIGSTDSIVWSTVPAGPFISNKYIDTPTMCFNSGTGNFTITLTIWYHGNPKAFSHNIVINPSPSPSITQVGSVLSTGGIGSGYYNYQWYNGTSAIPGATSSSLTWYPSPGVGAYKVKVDSNGCTGYSTVYNVTTTGITKVNLPDNNKYWLSQQGVDNSVINLYAAHAVDAPLSVVMFDATGRELLSDMWDKGLAGIQIKAASLPPGMYLIKLTNSNTSQVLKWVKN